MGEVAKISGATAHYASSFPPPLAGEGEGGERGRRRAWARVIQSALERWVASMADDDDILRVNAAYYRAFATADFTAMSRIWAKEQVVHPSGLAGADRP